MFGIHKASSEFCLICFDAKDHGLLDSLFFSDPLCMKCRDSMSFIKIKYTVSDMKILSLYVYESFVRTQIIQYKESFDELLHKIFVWPLRFSVWFFYHDYSIVCVPTTQHSINRRGFDHMKLIASCLGNDILEDILIKKDSPKQSLLHVDERREVHKYFSINNSAQLKGKKIILIDDVVTTGASLLACYHLLLPHCKKVKVIGLCVHPKLLEKT